MLGTDRDDPKCKLKLERSLRNSKLDCEVLSPTTTTTTTTTISATTGQPVYFSLSFFLSYFLFAEKKKRYIKHV